MRRRTRLVTARHFCVGLGLALALTGCSAPEATGPVTPTPSSTAAAPQTPSSSPSSTQPAEPTLVPAGTAKENLPLFAAVVAGVWASPQQVAGRAYVDALAAAGFDKGAMQLTPDQSTVGNPAESIQFSVRWGQECVIGQVGPATGTPVTVVVPALAEGTCLIGDTRPIDW